MKKKSYDGREQPIQGPALGYHIMDTGDSDYAKTEDTEYLVGEGMEDRDSLAISKSLGFHIIDPDREYQMENDKLKGEIIDQVFKKYIQRKEDDRPFKT